MRARSPAVHGLQAWTPKWTGPGSAPSPPPRTPHARAHVRTCACACAHAHMRAHAHRWPPAPAPASTRQQRSGFVRPPLAARTFQRPVSESGAVWVRLEDGLSPPRYSLSSERLSCRWETIMLLTGVDKARGWGSGRLSVLPPAVARGRGRRTTALVAPSVSRAVFSVFCAVVFCF